jgi:hypothetical protein
MSVNVLWLKGSSSSSVGIVCSDTILVCVGVELINSWNRFDEALSPP